MANLKPPSINFEYEGDEVIEEPKGKTGREWILGTNLLNISQSANALRYLQISGFLDEPFGSIASCIMSGFTWHRTEEGGDFWARIHEQASQQERNL